MEERGFAIWLILEWLADLHGLFGLTRCLVVLVLYLKPTRVGWVVGA